MADKLVGQSNELWHLQHWAEVAPKRDLLNWMRSHHKGPLPPIEEVRCLPLLVTEIYMYFQEYLHIEPFYLLVLLSCRKMFWTLPQLSQLWTSPAVRWTQC